ncbi:MAG: hypothetical protein ACK5RD_19665, partial [Aphanizomenon sp.]
MAWEEFERNGISGISGDKPIDELALALNKISAAYQDRFSRKPTITEIFYALETVIGSHPTRYVSDTEGLRSGSIIFQRDFENEGDYVDITQYEGVYTELTIPGYYVVLQKNSNENSNSKTEVIKIPTLEVRNRILSCEYEILINDITDKIAETLILTVLL